jgi:uncharacterized phosphosugar-binding protein
VRDHLEAAERANAAVLEAVARKLCEVVRSDGLVFVAGTGHSLALVLECFYRAGGLACVYPIYHPALLPLEGGEVTTMEERTSGLGRLLVERIPAGASDLAVVYSNSGVNPVPVEIAEELRTRGTPVVGVTSRDHMARAPARHPRRLGDVVDYLIDTLVPYGDAVYDAGGGVKTMPLSSLTSVYLWNLLLVRAAEIAAARGDRLPVWTSANVEGGEEQNRRLLERYRKRVPRL